MADAPAPPPPAAAEAALRGGEARFRRLIENASDLITILDADGVIRYESPALTPMLGYAPNELTGRSAFSFLPREDVGPTAEAFRRVLAEPGVPHAFAFRFRHRDGSWRAVESVGTTLSPTSAAEGVVVNSRDVTARVAAERALRESEALQQAIIASALDAIISVDADGHIVAFNPAAERMTGHRAADVMGRPMAELVIPARFRDAHEAGMARYRATGHGRMAGQRLEVVALRADGSEFPVEVALDGVLTDDGRAVFTAFLRDLTASKAAEAALQSAQARLVQQEKLAGLGRLTAGIAHEIKNPLNFINNFAAGSRELLAELRQVLARHPEVLATDEMATLLDDLDAAAARVAEHGERADRIVRGMMDHARTGPQERRRVALNGLVDDHVRLALGEQVATGVVERDYGADVGEVEVMVRGFGRAVANLVANALDAVEARAEAARAAGAPEGGAPYVPRVTVRTRRAGGRVEVAVADNGPGVAAADLDRIFEPFYTTKPPGRGNVGLGLSLAREAVAAHGGTLEVESRPGDGTTFTLSLPA